MLHHLKEKFVLVQEIANGMEDDLVFPPERDYRIEVFQWRSRSWPQALRRWVTASIIDAIGYDLIAESSLIGNHSSNISSSSFNRALGFTWTARVVDFMVLRVSVISLWLHGSASSHTVLH